MTLGHHAHYSRLRIGRALSLTVVLAGGLLSVSPAESQTWEIGDALAQIGVVDQPPPGNDVLDYVLDIAVDASGNIYVVDESSPRLRVFSPQGTFLDVAGRRGRGPGEFQSPTAIAIDASGRAHVVDPGNAKIATYRLEDGRFRFEQDTRLTFLPRDLCVLGTRRFLLAGQGLLIREVDERGRTLQEFGEREEPQGSLRSVFRGTDQFLNYAILTCHEEAGLILLLHYNFGIVRAFTPTGEEVWRKTLADWHQQGFRRLASGRCCEYNIPDPASGTFHYATAMDADGVGQIAVALTESRPGSAPTYDLRIMNTVDGTEIARHRSTPIEHPARFLAISTDRL